MTADEIVRVINNSNLMDMTSLLNRLPKICPEVKSVSIIDKKDLGLSGILATARFYLDKDEVIIRGFLYDCPNWDEATHGYVTAKKI